MRIRRVLNLGEISPESHLKLKLLATAKGMSITKFVAFLTEKEWEEKKDTISVISQNAATRAVKEVTKKYTN